MKIDLRNCKEGDILITSLGGVCEYLSPLDESDYFDHKIKYLHIPDDTIAIGDSCEGSRTHDGFVFRKNRIPKTDHDIVKVLTKKEAAKVLTLIPQARKLQELIADHQ
jgi:hypothetical protein